MADRLTIEDLDPATVAQGVADGQFLLVDVREPSEYDAEHIEGALLFPLSTFDPAALPDPEGRAIVFQCAAGGRSARAAEAAIAAGVPANRHLAGGIAAWKRAGLPTTR
ncbi:rhodanese-like domain-containing protein [Mesorhizobium sp. BR1-1-16]|uniref:rhodanese-like domain-containing protein n=1 Tax=Mesorhizobium sp. BR1-1-16 TaxID=2876653 RepID=UPI001CC8F520|nr:rhodanese-like domain-containing protein [Mesorhizobium sp. BR1-1-16]MBZ9937982.1 rhodanese-like domain-containing protein [Mesorhizobium sp. BR1-1-16]